MSSRGGAAGFTLIEVVVALVVIALALTTLIAGFGRQAQTAAELDARTLAMIVAHNRLTEIELEPVWPDTGRADGRVELAGRDWRWYTEVSETDDPALRRIDIRITRDARGDEHTLASLSGFMANTGRGAP